VPLLKLDIDPEAYARLVAEADTERRPITWQAEIMLRRALGLPFPPAETREAPNCQPVQEAAS
jgi:hypothetical protein